MLRRNFLSILASTPFLTSLVPLKKQEKSAHRLGLRNPKKLTKRQILRDGFICELPFKMHDYMTFPIETEVIIEYENGSESYLCLNMILEDYADLTLDTFLSCRAIESGTIENKYDYTVMYRNNKLKLSQISVG